MSNLNNKKNHEYCRSLVKNHDYDRYLISLFADKENQPDLWSLFAFNYEIAKTREIVTETQLGLIRLQWWREALDPVFTGGEAKSHQVLKPLADAIHRYKLPKEPFETLIYAREFDLEDAAPADIDGLVKYIDHVSVPLTKLCLRILGEDSLNRVDHRLRHGVDLDVDEMHLLFAGHVTRPAETIVFPRRLGGIMIEADELRQVDPDEFLVKALRCVARQFGQVFLFNLGSFLFTLLGIPVLILLLFRFVAPLKFSWGFTEVEAEKTVDLGQGLFLGFSQGGLLGPLFMRGKNFHRPGAQQTFKNNVHDAGIFAAMGLGHSGSGYHSIFFNQ